MNTNSETVRVGNGSFTGTLEKSYWENVQTRLAFDGDFQVNLQISDPHEDDIAEFVRVSAKSLSLV